MRAGSHAFPASLADQARRGAVALSLALLHPDRPTPQVTQKEPLRWSSHHWHRRGGNQRPFHRPGSERGGDGRGVRTVPPSGCTLWLDLPAGQEQPRAVILGVAFSRCRVEGAVTPTEPNEAPPGPAEPLPPRAHTGSCEQAWGSGALLTQADTPCV